MVKVTRKKTANLHVTILVEITRKEEIQCVRLLNGQDAPVVEGINLEDGEPYNGFFNARGRHRIPGSPDSRPAVLLSGDCLISTIRHHLSPLTSAVCARQDLG